VCEYEKIEGGKHSVCSGAVHMMADFLMPALADGVFSNQRVCNELMKVCKTPKIVELNVNDYVKEKLNSKP